MFRGAGAVIFLIIMTWAYASGGISHKAYWGSVAISVVLSAVFTFAHNAVAKGREEARIKKLRRIREGKTEEDVKLGWKANLITFMFWPVIIFVVCKWGCNW